MADVADRVAISDAPGFSWNGYDQFCMCSYCVCVGVSYVFEKEAVCVGDLLQEGRCYLAGVCWAVVYFLC
jgi:hypothetical protein